MCMSSLQEDLEVTSLMTHPEIHNAQAAAPCTKSDRHLLHSILFWAGGRHIGIYVAKRIGGCANWISHDAL